jgi:CheY-like chemotaxis protein
LDFSKIESGKLELEEQPFELRTCIEESLDLVAAKAAEKKLELAYFFDPLTPNWVMGDVTRLRQILVNLLSNAVKFTQEGEVLVSVLAHRSQESSRFAPNSKFKIQNSKNNQELGDLQSNSWQMNGELSPIYEIQFAVKDTGIGIPSNRMERLFQSFSQVDSSTTRKYGGTGLGLVISQRLAELMGGRMWVESQEGMGSTFYFTAMVESVPSPSPEALETQTLLLTGKRLLIVDDNATNRQILTLQAQSWGMLSQATESGYEALDWLARGEQFDMAILDMQMPGMDGLMLAAEIRKQCRSQDLPLVMLTSIGKPEIQSEALKVGFAAFLNKPVKQSQLYNVLIHILSGQPVKVKPSQTQRPELDSTMAQRLPLRILLVEDNKVNQQLALQLLARMGYRADIAGNGLEAIQALRRQPYDVVFMDVHMPEMDGLTATQQICQEWPPTSRPKIIAMTANAMQGDREKCLSVGMDNYISKPIRVEELVRALHQCQSSDEDSQPLPSLEETALNLDAQPSVSLDLQDAIDTDVLQTFRQTMGASANQFLAQLIDVYLEETPVILQAIATAIHQDNATAMQHAAHTLKSSSASLGAIILSTLCQQLESMGHSSTTSGALEIMVQLEFEYERVKIGLQQTLLEV